MIKNKNKGLVRLSSAKQKFGGFTLVELLMVIAIIGVLSSVVFSSLKSARVKARKAATIATLRGVVPELITCADDGGIGPTAVPTTSLYVCATTAAGTVAYAGHTITWPALPTGWNYGTPTGALASTNYVYSATGDSLSVSCSQATGACQ